MHETWLLARGRASRRGSGSVILSVSLSASAVRAENLRSLPFRCLYSTLGMHMYTAYGTRSTVTRMDSHSSN